MKRSSLIVGLVLIAAPISIAVLILLDNIEPRSLEPTYTSLHQAALYDVGQIRRLVDAGARLDGLDANGQTPLWVAVRYDKADAVHHLLELGAVPDFAGPDGDAPILAATFMGSQSVDTLIVEQLLVAGADVNAVSRQYQETPLHYAVKSNNREVVQLLVNSGANINAQSSKSDTPLQFAVVKGHLAILDLLLESGADPELRNTAGFRPIDQLNACPNPERVQEVFRAHGVDDQRRPELLAAARATGDE